jgi:hypothetical protein
VVDCVRFCGATVGANSILFQDDIALGFAERLVFSARILRDIGFAPATRCEHNYCGSDIKLSVFDREGTGDVF